MKTINTYALSLAASISIALITLMTVVGEVNKPFKDILYGLTGHHWVSKSIISLVFFVLAYLALSSQKKDDVDTDSAMNTVWTVIISGLIIFGFFLWHGLSH